MGTGLWEQVARPVDFRASVLGLRLRTFGKRPRWLRRHGKKGGRVYSRSALFVVPQGLASCGNGQFRATDGAGPAGRGREGGGRVAGVGGIFGWFGIASGFFAGFPDAQM